MIRSPSNRSVQSVISTSTVSTLPSLDQPIEQRQRSAPPRSQATSRADNPAEIEKRQRVVTKYITQLCTRELRRQRNRNASEFDADYVNKASDQFRAWNDILVRECRNGLSPVRPDQTAAGKLKGGVRLAGGAMSTAGAAVVAGTIAATSAAACIVPGIVIGAVRGAVDGYRLTNEALQGAPKPLRHVASAGAALLGASVMAVVTPLVVAPYRCVAKGSPMSKTFIALNRLPQAMEKAAFKKMSTREIGHLAVAATNDSLDEIYKKGDEYAAENTSYRIYRTVSTRIDMV